MKHSQTVRHVKQKNITFYTVANMKKKGRCYLKQKKLQKKQPIHHHLNNGRCAWRGKLYA